MINLWLASYIALWAGFVALATMTIVALANLGAVHSSFAALSQQVKPMVSKLKLGDSLPEIRLKTLSGTDLSTLTLKGEPRSFAMVSPTCGPCRTYLHTLATDPGDGSSLGLTVRPLVVSLGDIDGTAAAVREALLPADIVVLVDAERQSTEKWGITGTPTTLVVDEQLRLVGQSAGIGCPLEQVAPATERPISTSGRRPVDLAPVSSGRT